MKIPLLKLGTLAVRTIARPIAAKLKIGAGLHPKFRQFIINMAQANHRISTIMQRKIYGRSTMIAIRPLNETVAVDAAAALLGEVFLFMVAGAAVIYEVQRNSKAEARKEELRRQEIEALKQSNKDLLREVDQLKCKMEQLSNRSFISLLQFRRAQPYGAQILNSKYAMS